MEPYKVISAHLALRHFWKRTIKYGARDCSPVSHEVNQRMNWSNSYLVVSRKLAEDTDYLHPVHIRLLVLENTIERPERCFALEKAL